MAAPMKFLLKIVAQQPTERQKTQNADMSFQAMITQGQLLMKFAIRGPVFLHLPHLALML